MAKKKDIEPIVETEFPPIAGEEFGPEEQMLTVNGQPIPEHLRIAIPYANTDQGIAEANATRNRTATKVSVTPRNPNARIKPQATEFEKQLAERRDFRLNSTEPWEAPNAMAELAEQHVGPGMRPHFVSQSKVTRDGLRGWNPVRDEDGNLVTLGASLVLAEMPEEKAQKRNQHFQELDKTRRAEIQENFVAKREELDVALGRAPGETRADRGPGGPLDGLRSVRGNSMTLDE